MTLKQLQDQAIQEVQATASEADLAQIKIKYLGKKGLLNQTFKALIKDHPDPKQLGQQFNQTKIELQQAIDQIQNTKYEIPNTNNWFDVTQPGPQLPVGHSHILTQTIDDITNIFKHIGFIRTRYREIDTDWYAAAGLNIPTNHPARDEQETFYIKSDIKNQQELAVDMLSDIGLTPHTSNGQLREMERVIKLSQSIGSDLKINDQERVTDGLIPIRMINIGKCYRRQADASHTSMFHQFEGLVVDKNISISHLKGTIDYFARYFFGPGITSRLRPYNFRFTEPSFEVDFTCSSCQGQGCRLCKEGWLEVGGAGMVHPTVLSNGGIDPDHYSGFAFGWGVERVAAIKHQIPDIRLLYTSDTRFLNQF